MKKTVIYSICALILLTGVNNAEAIQISPSDISVVTGNEKSASDIEVVYETSIVNIVKTDNKYGIIDNKTGQYIIKPVLDQVTPFSKNNDFEYKIKTGDMLGYLNILTKDSFLSHYSDIWVLNDKFLKVKTDSNYGILDKKGKVIIPAEYQKIVLTQHAGVEYFVAKKNKKNIIFDEQGVKATEESLTGLKQTKNGFVLGEKMSKILKKNEIQEKTFESKSYVEPDNVTIDIEIEKLPIPTTKRAQKTPDDEVIKEISSMPKNESAQGTSVEIKEMALPSNVQKLSVKQEGYSDVLTEKPKTGKAVDVITIKKKSYYVVKDGEKLGVQTRNGKEIVPAEYDSLTVKSIGTKDSAIYAVNEKERNLYLPSGSLIAKRFHDKINVFTSMRKYEYYKEGDVYIVGFNNKKMGELKLNDDGTYEYTRTKFNFSNMKKANDIFITYLNSIK